MELHHMTESPKLLFCFVFRQAFVQTFPGEFFFFFCSKATVDFCSQQSFTLVSAGEEQSKRQSSRVECGPHTAVLFSSEDVKKRKTSAVTCYVSANVHRVEMLALLPVGYNL